MLCYVKINALDCEDRNELMGELVSAGYANEADQARWGGSDECIVVAANTNPTNSAGRVHLSTIAGLADKYSCDVSYHEKDHADGPSRNELVQCTGTDDWYYECECKEFDGELYCEEYFDDNFCECECGHTVRSGREVCSESGESYCRDCYNEQFDSCEVCGCEVCRDDSYYSERHGGTVCSDHYSEDGVQEFDGRSKRFDETNSFGSSRYFGLELETDCGRVSENFAFDGKDDGSIDGTEFVSHKLRGDAGLNEVKEFMRTGDGIEVSSSCGFHLHADMSGMSDRELYVVFAAFAATEDKWRSRVKDSRNGNSYCRRLEGDLFYSILEAEANGDDFSDWCDNRDRYYWMNTSAYTKHSTFENRLHEGTWTYCEVERWVKLNLRFIEAARTLRFWAGETIESFKARANECFAFAESTALVFQPSQPAKLEAVA